MEGLREGGIAGMAPARERATDETSTQGESHEAEGLSGHRDLAEDAPGHLVHAQEVSTIEDQAEGISHLQDETDVSQHTGETDTPQMQHQTDIPHRDQSKDTTDFPGDTSDLREQSKYTTSSRGQEEDTADLQDQAQDATNLTVREDTAPGHSRPSQDSAPSFERQTPLASPLGGRLHIPLPSDPLARDWSGTDPAAPPHNLYLLHNLLPTLVPAMEQLLVEAERRGLTGKPSQDPREPGSAALLLDRGSQSEAGGDVEFLGGGPGDSDHVPARAALRDAAWGEDSGPLARFNPADQLARQLMRDNPRWNHGGAPDSPYLRGLAQAAGVDVGRPGPQGLQ
ncbi:EF-hand calcium-binding domain-containing protein 5 [Petromyzon marinus]|uniref:Uncharacterized protein LOC116950230 n=1 Tax=Petromyzon marinus TaxID=7757 RepID=A0AAJ7TTE4_PETMA|nr:uncharacterized protein LOC116950230 [Petromyzon marinus]